MRILVREKKERLLTNSAYSGFDCFSLDFRLSSFTVFSVNVRARDRTRTKALIGDQWSQYKSARLQEVWNESVLFEVEPGLLSMV